MEYSLEISDDNSVFVVVPTYTSNLAQHTLNTVTDSLTLGSIYYFRMRARNSIGWGEYGAVLLNAGFIGLPAKPNTPQRVESQSNKTQITVLWDSIADTDLPAGQITGYRLYMAEGPSGQFVLAHDGREVPQTLQFVVSGLTTGQLYRFKVTAFNINGEGPASDEMTTYAC